MSRKAAERGPCGETPSVPAILRRLGLGGLGIILAGRGAAQTQHPSLESLPAQPPVGGFFWTWIVPVLLFAVALAATFALYRHFSGVQSPTSRDGRAT